MKPINELLTQKSDTFNWYYDTFDSTVWIDILKQIKINVSKLVENRLFNVTKDDDYKSYPINYLFRAVEEYRYEKSN